MEKQGGRVHNRYVPVLGFAVVALLSGGTHSWAAQTALLAGYSLEYSDNITRSLSPNSDLTQILHLGGAYADRTSTAEIDVRGEAFYRDYTYNTYGNSITGTLDANGLWNISPDRFTWAARDRLAMSTVDPLSPATPANQQKVNVFETGPDFRVRFSSVSSLVLGSRAIYARYQTTPSQDSDQVSATARLEHVTPAKTLVSLNLVGNDVRFPSPLYQNYRRVDAYGGIEGKHGSSTLEANIGATLIQTANQPDRIGKLVNARYEYQVNPTVSIAGSFDFEYSDVSRDILVSPTVENPNATSGGLFYGRRADLILAQNAADQDMMLRLFVRDRDYVDPIFNDEQSLGASGVYRRVVGGRSDVTLFGDYLDTRYPALSRTDAEVSFGAQYRLRLRPRWSWLSELRRNYRDSTDPTAIYTENVISTGIVYERGRFTNPNGIGRR